MKIDNKGRVLSFSEKPKGNDLKAMVILNKSHDVLEFEFVSIQLLILISVNSLASRYNCFGTFKGRG